MTDTVKVMIADDEPLLRFHLQKTLEELWPACEVVATASHGQEVLDLFAAVKPDVLFLDIRMPEMDGLECSLKLMQGGHLDQCDLVFLTAYDEYALAAFERGAIDYLLKPLEENRLLETIQRIESRRQSDTQPDIAQLQQWVINLQHQSSGGLKWVNAQKGEAIVVVSIEDVLAFVAEDKYTTVVQADGEAIIRTTIKELEQQLDPNQFWRIHRSTIVQVAKIDEVHKGLTGKLTVQMRHIKREFPVSRAYSQQFKSI